MINPLINHVRNLKAVRTYIKVRVEAMSLEGMGIKKNSLDYQHVGRMVEFHISNIAKACHPTQWGIRILHDIVKVGYFGWISR